MSDAQILVVTSAGASAGAVVPVLAAIEAAGMRVRAIDLGGAGGGGTGVADRVRRALLGEGAERRLRRELEVSPPDVAVVFDPHAALALTVARDQVQNPAPVVAVVAELEPAAAWAQTDADRFVAVDELAAVALADAGVEGDRILVVGAVGERAFADAGAQDRAALRQRFKLGGAGQVALVEVAGLGAEQTGQLALQLSLLDGSDRLTFLFDAAGDADAAAVLRRQVPGLGLRGKLFGATADAALYWRAADTVIARPSPEVVSRVLLLGARLVALIDDSVAGGAKAAAALEARGRAIPAKGLLLLASALETALRGAPPAALPDGGDNIADIVAAVAADKRGVIDERRSAAQAATRDRVRAASSATQAAAAATAMPGELEDLGGGPAFDEEVHVPDAAEVGRLRAEVEQRKAEMSRSMMAARDAATSLAEQATAARARGAADEAAGLDRRADAERSRMHALLAELATLEAELAELERVRRTVAAAPRPPPRAASAGGAGSSAGAAGAGVADASPPPRRVSIDDALSDLKKRAGTQPSASASASASTPRPKPASSGASSSGSANVDDELAALKRKMAAAPPKKKSP
jgi:Monogalactosyldiacylglycerol (MGDG) synthase